MEIEYYEGELKDLIIEALESQLDTLKATDEIHAVKWFRENLSPKARKNLIDIEDTAKINHCYQHYGCKYLKD